MVLVIIWVDLKIGVPSRILYITVPYYIWDLERDPNLENYPCISAGEYYTITIIRSTQIERNPIQHRVDDINPALRIIRKLYTMIPKV